MDITSTSNPRIKELVMLGEKSRYRREKGLFTVEGRREAAACLAGGFTPRTVFYCPQIISAGGVEGLFAASRVEFVSISENVYSKIAYRGTTEGLVAVFKAKERGLRDIRLSNSSPFVIVLESVEKPGNLGAVLRTADASGAWQIFPMRRVGTSDVYEFSTYLSHGQTVAYYYLSDSTWEARETVPDSLPRVGNDRCLTLTSEADSISVQEKFGM